MSSQLAQQLAILYEDDTVQVFRDKICILKYYFPIPASKNIDMIDVQAIHLRDNVDGQVWGTSPGHMDTWFALDNERHLKKQYLEIVVRGSDVKVAFSPNDPNKVMAIIETNSSLLRAEHQMKTNSNLHKENQKYQSEKRQEGVETINQPLIVQPQSKSLGESIKEKIGQKIQGLKNVKDSLKQKYQEGKQNAYVSPNNKIDIEKEKFNQNLQYEKAKTGQKYVDAGEVLQEKGNQMKKDAFWNA